jgi:hypothetical protein
MVGPPIDPGAAHYVRMISAHRREVGRHWPLVLIALGIVIAIGVASPDRSKIHAPPPPIASATTLK